MEISRGLIDVEGECQGTTILVPLCVVRACCDVMVRD